MVRFDAHPQLWAMAYLACENPQCACGEVICDFRQVTPDGRPDKSGLQFALRIKVDTWQIVERLGGWPGVESLIEEFQAGLSYDVKQDILASYTPFRKAIENAGRFRASAKKIRSGRLFSAAEVFGVDGPPIPGALGRAFQTTFEKNIYRIDDFYCMNPSCQCLEVHLCVSQIGDDGQPLHLFDARYGFTSTLAELTRLRAGVSADWGGQLLRNWTESNPTAVTDIVERYNRLKEVGKRLVSKRRR